MSDNFKILIRNKRRMNEFGFEETKDLLDAYGKLEAENKGLDDSIHFLVGKLIEVKNKKREAYMAIVDWDMYRGRTGHPHIKEDQSK